MEHTSELITQAQAEARAGRLAEAEELWRRVLTAEPGSQTAALGLTKLLDGVGRRAEAEAVLRAFVAAGVSPAGILAAARQWEAWEKTPREGVRVFRVALTGTGTLAPLGAHLRVACAGSGLHPAVYVSEFNQWAQDLLPAGSALYEFAPDLIILFLDPAALFPKTVSSEPRTVAEVAVERDAGLAQIRDILTFAARNAPSAAFLLHTFALPDYAPLGILDAISEDGQRAHFEAMNRGLAAMLRRDFPRVLLLDQERTEARHGKSRVRDDRLWYMASMPLSESFLPVMAAEYIRTIRPLTGLTRKCVVLDLDNTLWGGVAGEDGLHGIKIGGTAAPGNAFADFQMALNGLRRRGILLALCSKNNPDDVWPIFDTHPDIPLKREHFAAARINWQDKATNIREIARELNLGLDSLVFLDDNPAERGLVRQELPGVLVPEMPRDPAYYTRLLLGLDVFETLALTDEDSRRSQLYAEQQARKEYEERVTGDSPTDLDAYLAGLEMTVTLAPATAFTVPRIAQLINKTNQFNLTTRRYTQAQVEALARPEVPWGIYAVSVADRFGDSGLTGAALVKEDAGVWEIDTFLLSCRVLGRGVEDAFLTYLIAEARAAGMTCLRGEFLPTAKNAPASGFYERVGFHAVSENAWELRLDQPEAAKSYPRWLSVTTTARTHTGDRT